MKDAKTLFSQLPQAEESAHESEYALLVDKTAKLIGRSYIQTHALVKNWPLHLIERRYKEATNCNQGFTKPAMRWWSLRKRDKFSA